MRVLFLRLMVAIAAVWLLTQGVFAAWAFATFDEQEFDHRSARRQARLDLAAQRLEREPPAARRAALDQMRPAFRAPLELLPPGATPPGPSVTLSDGQVLVGGPMGRRPPPLGLLGAQTVLGGLALMGLLGWVSRPLRQGLHVLEEASARLGDGDLSARTRLVGGPVGEVGVRFDAMAARLQALVDGQRELLAAVSHELRTPMTRLRFQLEAADGLPPESLEAIDTELEAMDGLLRELLDVARLASDPHEPAAPEESVAVVEEVVARHRDLAAARGVSLRVQGRGGLSMSRPDQVRVVDNLVTNAVRHAAAVVRITLSDGRLLVDDDGPGVPPAERSRIFEPFHTGDPSRSRQTGGVGLGLALVQRAVSRWGGEVSVQDGPLGGARFEVRLRV